jgi:SAM-dependent methyltransferase
MDHLQKTREFFRDTVRPIMEYTRRRRVDILLDYVDGKDVLDLGCVEHEAVAADHAQWWLHGLIKPRCRSLVGVDYDPVAAAELNRQGYNIVVGDVENLDLGRRFDVVMSGELFEHLTNHRSFLEGVKRHLKDDGVWVASMPNANGLNYFLQTALYGHELDAWDHAAFFTPVTLSVMLNKCGMEPVKIILYQPDEIFHHETFVRRWIAYTFNKLQQVTCVFAPSLARGLIVVARPLTQKIGEAATDG